MITADGYSKDPSLIPEGIVVTWSKDLINDKGGLLNFIRYFEMIMREPEGVWLQKCRNKPGLDRHLLTVYIIVCNRLLYKCYYGGYQTGAANISNGDGRSWSSSNWIEWSRVVLCGPFEKAPRKIILKGFQGFRYCTKLF